MSIQSSLRFNPRNYVRTVFFAENGNDNNSGLSPEKPKATFYGANAAAALIPLAAGERGCIILVGEGEFDHTDVTGLGTEALTDRWDVHMECGTLYIVKGTDPITSAKLVITNSELYLNRLDLNSGGRLTLEAANASSRGSIGTVRGNVNTVDGDATTAGKIHILSSATDARFEYDISTILSRTNIFLTESDTAEIDMTVNTTLVKTTADTFDVYDILDSNGTFRLWRVESSGGVGVTTGLISRGNAKVCVASNEFIGMDVDFNSKSTSSIRAILCTNNGNSLKDVGATLLILAPEEDEAYVTDYFVSSDIGDDTNSGLSPHHAFATLEKALDTGEAGAVPYTIHILDDGEYEIQSASGTRSDSIAFKLIHKVATIKGAAGGLVWKIPNSQIEGYKIIGTNLTFEPSTTNVEVQHNWVEIDDQNLLYRSSGAAQANFRIQVQFMVGRGDNGFCDISNNAKLLVVGQLSQSIFNSASNEGAFKVSGSGSVVDVHLQNSDGRNDGAGDAYLMHITDNATGFIRSECKTNNINGGFVDTGGKLYTDLSGILGEPAVYTNGGAGVLHTNSLAQGLDFQYLNATAGLSLTDLINIHDIGTGEQVKATLTELSALIGGGGFLTSTLTPAQITAHQNDYSPAGLAINQMLRLDSDANYDITGLDSTGFSDRDTIVIINIGAKDLKLKENSGSSLAANRFLINADISLQAEEAATLVYDATSLRWRCIGEHV